MSLVNTLMNGGTYGVSVNTNRYSHSDGASIITMESTAELHDIFMESFYNVEQAELAAATEGVSLEGSQYEAVAEAATVGAFEKIKNFFKKLWAKVKAFFHNVRRYLDAIFMSGSSFAKKYEKEISKIGPLKDFSYKMFKYNDKNIDEASAKTKFSDMVDDLTHKTEIDAVVTTLKSGKFGSNNAPDIQKVEEVCSHDAMSKMVVSKLSENKCTDPDDFDEWLYGYFRSGASGADDKDDVDITSVSDFMKTLKDSGKLTSNLDSMQRETDKAFKNATKYVDDGAKAAESFKSTATKTVQANDGSNVEVPDKGARATQNSVASDMAKVLRLYSSTFSIANSYCTKFITAWKQVVNERDGVYKAVIMAAFAHAKKQNKRS